jgi:membrane fusion protein
MNFRKEASKLREDIGSIVVVGPPHFLAYALGSMLIAAAVCAFLAFASYTKKARVTGVLVPQDGLLRLHARETAAVREQRVQEGAQVRQGDVLFVLAAERVSAGGSDADGNLAAIIASRRAAIEREALAQRALRAQERMQLMDRMAAARQQLDQIRAELALQVTRTQLAQEAVTRQRQLVGQGFVAAAAADIKEAELLAERSRELGLRRSVQGAAADIDNLESALRQMAPREAAEDAATARLLTSMDQEAGELNARREFAIRAPHDGVVTSIQAHVGQAAAPTVPLATLVPVGSELLAHLYVPSRAVGFIEAGRTVLVRYQAFPYQKFGQYAARVQSVAKAALSTQELTSLSLNAGGDSLYRVIVKLDTQHVMAYGQPQPLQAGMQLEADILLDRRRLIEWVFEPIFSLTRRA